MKDCEIFRDKKQIFQCSRLYPQLQEQLGHCLHTGRGSRKTVRLWILPHIQPSGDRLLRHHTACVPRAFATQFDYSIEEEWAGIGQRVEMSVAVSCCSAHEGRNSSTIELRQDPVLGELGSLHAPTDVQVYNNIASVQYGFLLKQSQKPIHMQPLSLRAPSDSTRQHLICVSLTCCCFTNSSVFLGLSKLRDLSFVQANNVSR